MKISNFKIIFIFVLFLIISCGPPKLSDATSFKIEDGTIYLSNGKQLTGKVNYPINSAESYISINIKKKKQSIDKTQIDKIVYNTSSGPLEYYNLKIFRNKKKNKIRKNKKIVALSIKGKVSLYFSQGSHYEQRGNMSVPVYFTEYYCKRENEEAASLIHVDNGVVNPNAYFRYFAKRYFSDNPEIVAKIKSKEFTYRNLIEVVQFYNSK
ncbi:MAG: hypothetical protein V4548_13095 [Bacteroidota bacterium]